MFVVLIMVKRIKRVCKVMGCSNLTIDKTGYCNICKPLNSQSNWIKYKPNSNRHVRGYGSKWDKIRPIVLDRDKHLCINCLSKGIARTAKCVDHIIPKSQGGTDELSNLQSLCWPCHKAKTAREGGVKSLQD